MKQTNTTAKFYDDFVSIWTKLHQSVESGDSFDTLKSISAPWRNAPINHDAPKKQKYRIALERLLNWDSQSQMGPSLGDALRCKVAQQCLSHMNNSDFQKCLQKHMPDNVGKGASSAFSTILTPFTADARKSGLSDTLKQAVCTAINIDLRQPKGMSKLEVDDVFGQPFTGKFAIKDFETFLQTDESYAQPFTPSLTYVCDSKARKTNLDAIKVAAFAPSEGPQVINIHAQGMRRGLSALGGKLTELFSTNPDTKFSKLRWLYLPVNNYLDHPNTKTWLPAPGFNILIGRLHHFYCGKLDDIASAPALSATADYTKALQEIREAMIVRPRILILDGVQVYSKQDRISSIERVITGDNVLDIVLALLDPALCAVHCPKDLSELSKNRIILLSNNALENDDFEHNLHHTVSLKNIPFIEPDPEEATKVINACRFKNQDEITKFREWNPRMITTWSDAHYYALDALLSFEKLRGNVELSQLEAELTELSKAHYQTTGQPEGLFALISMALDKIPIEYGLLKKLLYLISAAPDGLRIGTLQRLMVGAISAGENQQLITKSDIERFKGARSFRSDTHPNEVIYRAIGFLLKEFPSLVRQSHDDFFHGVDGAPHPLELGISPAPIAAPTKDDVLSIQFYFPEFRLVVRDALAGDKPDSTFQLCHRLLAEDALSQQTVGLRHGDFSENQSIHHWRRQFAAFYHGLCSLPIYFKDEARIRKGQLQKDLNLQTITPKKPREFWRWLYLFAYRRMIEQPPVYAMSRIYGEELIKRDLLEAFNQPWKLWPHTYVNRLQVKARDKHLFIGEYLSEVKSPTQLKNGRSVVQAFYFSLFQSHYILGELSAMDQVMFQIKILVKNLMRMPKGQM